LTSLLTFLPAADAESHVIAALHHDYFLLGDQAKNLTLRVLARSSQRQLSSADLSRFLSDVWELHQVEDAEALPYSDLVMRFFRLYAQ
jgi:hypothetical protein